MTLGKILIGFYGSCKISDKEESACHAFSCILDFVMPIGISSSEQKSTAQSLIAQRLSSGQNGQPFFRFTCNKAFSYTNTPSSHVILAKFSIFSTMCTVKQYR